VFSGCRRVLAGRFVRKLLQDDRFGGWVDDGSHAQPAPSPAAARRGGALHEVRRFDEAITACQDAIAIYRETGNQYREGIMRENLERARAAQQP
jgi:hypothetical protein